MSLKFSEAMAALEEGKKVRLTTWVPDNYWASDTIDWKINELHMLGNWEIYHPPKPKKIVEFMEVVVPDNTQGYALVWKDQASLNYFTEIWPKRNYTKTGKTKTIELNKQGEE